MVVHPDGLARTAPKEAHRALFVNQVDDAPQIRFSLALVAGKNIGFAAIAAGPLAIVNAVLLAAASVAKLARRLFSGPAGRRRPDP